LLPRPELVSRLERLRPRLRPALPPAPAGGARFRPQRLIPNGGGSSRWGQAAEAAPTLCRSPCSCWRQWPVGLTAPSSPPAARISSAGVPEAEALLPCPWPWVPRPPPECPWQAWRDGLVGLEPCPAGPIKQRPDRRHPGGAGTLPITPGARLRWERLWKAIASTRTTWQPLHSVARIQLFDAYVVLNHLVCRILGGVRGFALTAPKS